jgi:hypothetical protein
MLQLRKINYHPKIIFYSLMKHLNYIKSFISLGMFSSCILLYIINIIYCTQGFLETRISQFRAELSQK